MRLTRRYLFSASHRLHAPGLSDERNRELYGKCNNPFGHGHNYVLAVSVDGPVEERTGMMVSVAALDRLVERSVLRGYHHRNMNTEIPAFASVVPTTENVAVEIRDRLLARWREAFPAGRPSLSAIRLYETRKNIVELSGSPE